jgi:hypothetical protein
MDTKTKIENGRLVRRSLGEGGWRMAKRAAAGRSSTPLSERRSPDPACWSSLDSRRVGDRRSNRQAIGRTSPGKSRVAVCDLLDTLVTAEKIRAELADFFSYSHVYSPILTYSHIKKYYFFLPAGWNWRILFTKTTGLRWAALGHIKPDKAMLRRLKNIIFFIKRLDLLWTISSLVNNLRPWGVFSWGKTEAWPN